MALDELGTGLATSVSSVLANRLMITVRRQYYGHDQEFTDDGSLSLGSLRYKTARQDKIRVSKTFDSTQLGAVESLAPADPGERHARASVEVSQYDEIEMQTFSERRGF